MSRDKIAKIAAIIRKNLGIEKQLYFPIIEVIELLAAECNDFNFEIVECDELQDTYATTNTHDNIIHIRQDVYDRAVKGNPRDRFTLCHELGHFFLHRPGTISNARGSVPKYCEPEWQANAFAGELMAPRNLIQHMDIDSIARECGMSHQAAIIQYNRCH